MRVAIIPARGGSKRIPRKNIKIFHGKPIIAYSIEVAINSGLFDRVIVSTDDKEIGEIAKEYGAEFPFIRPCELSGDYVGTNDVLKHAITWLKENDSLPEIICCIYATAPFLNQKYLAKGLSQLLGSDKKFAFSVTSYSFPIQRAIKINDGAVSMFYPENFLKRSQDLEESFHDAGQFYWGFADAFMEDKVMFSKNSTPVILPRHLVQDIDTIEDWNRAELIYQVINHSK